MRNGEHHNIFKAIRYLMNEAIKLGMWKVADQLNRALKFADHYMVQQDVEPTEEDHPTPSPNEPGEDAKR